MLLSICQCTSPTTRNYLAPNVTSTEVENPVWEVNVCFTIWISTKGRILTELKDHLSHPQNFPSANAVLDSWPGITIQLLKKKQINSLTTHSPSLLSPNHLVLRIRLIISKQKSQKNNSIPGCLKPS
jgi:hypothetical protein